jgi:enoyl-CoA hydratase/3-hydroxyacyl-CoA dehydrogenase
VAALEIYPGYVNPLLGSPRRDLPKHVAIVGAGTIGPDIGYYLKVAIPDMTLTLIDVREEALAACVTRFEGYAQKAVDRKKMKPEAVAGVLANIVTSTDYDAMKGADLVIEAATENVPLKKKIFAMIEERVSPEAIIASNTSSIPAAWLFDDLAHPERTTVTHFFAPAWRNPAVEVITWEKGDRAVVDYLRWLFAVTGKAPVVTADVIAFMLDRIFDNWSGEAGWLLDRATTKQVDAVAEEFAAVGPFFVLDMSNGNPITHEANTRQAEEGDCYLPTDIFLSVNRWIVKKRGENVEMSDATRAAIRDRFLGVLCSQTLDIIARGIGTPEDLNLGCTLALGFKTGTPDMLASLGRDEVERLLRRLEAERPGFPGLALLDHVPTATSYKRYVLEDRIDDIVVLTVRRPAQLNALNEVVTDELLRTFKAYEQDPSVSGFVVTGYGTRAFCAGADIGRFTDMLGDREASVDYSRETGALLMYMDTMAKPVVAAVNGLALGGGFELATRCHDIVASPMAYFQLPEVTLGILPGIGGLVVPFRRWPEAAPVWTGMICHAERLTAQKAVELGMVSALEADYEALVHLAAKRTRELAGRVPLAMSDQAALAALVIDGGEPVGADGQTLSRETLDIIVGGIKAGLAAPDLPTALEEGFQAFGRVATTRAAAEGIGAFLAGRKPDFTGM